MDNTNKDGNKSPDINFHNKEASSTVYVPFTVTENDEKYDGTLIIDNKVVGGMQLSPEYEIIWVDAEPEECSDDEIIDAYDGHDIDKL